MFGLTHKNPDSSFNTGEMYILFLPDFQVMTAFLHEKPIDKNIAGQYQLLSPSDDIPTSFLFRDKTPEQFEEWTENVQHQQSSKASTGPFIWFGNSES